MPQPRCGRLPNYQNIIYNRELTFEDGVFVLKIHHLVQEPLSVSDKDVSVASVCRGAHLILLVASLVVRH